MTLDGLIILEKWKSDQMPYIEIDIEWEKIGNILNSANLKEWQQVFQGIDSNDTIERIFKTILQDANNNPNDYQDVLKGIQPEYLITLKTLIEKTLQYNEENKHKKCHS